MSQLKFRHRLVAFLVAAAAVTAAVLPATPAAAATPAPNQGHPSEMRQAADRLSQPPPPPSPARATAAMPRAGSPPAARPTKEVFGFAQASRLGSTTGVGWNTWNFGAVTTVAYFGINVDNGGHLVTSDTGWSFWAGANRGETQNMISAARAAGARVVLTIVSQKSSTDECTTLQSWPTTVNETVNQVENQFPGQIAGVNVDYESGQAQCGTTSNRTLLTTMVNGLRSSFGATAHLTVDTYASSAGDLTGFFDVAGMAPYVNGFFVMAYDLDNDNYLHAPLNCSRYCFSPNSPLSGYFWNDTTIAEQYVSAVGAGKTILGLPYYGWTACVGAPAANAYPLTPSSSAHWVAPTYDDSVSIAADPTFAAAYHTHRDGYDPTARWDDYYNPTYGCTRESYWNDVSSLNAKYDWVNQSGIEGVGVWSLDYGGGHSELWNALISHFTMLPSAPTGVAAFPGNTFANVSWNPASSPSPITSYAIRAYDGGATAPAAAATVPGNAISASVPGLTNGHSYTFTVTASNGYGAGQPSDLSNPVIPDPPPGAWPGRYHGIAPTRVIDTRSGQGGLTRFGAGTRATVDLLGLAGIPRSSATAAVVNVTVANASSPTYVSATPSGSSTTAVSTVNVMPGLQAANLTQVALGADGQIQLYNSSGAVDVIVDLVGWFGNSSDLAGDGHYNPISPTRVLDTRSASQGFGVIGGGQIVRVQVAGVNGVPAGSSAVVNLTAVGGSAPSYLTAWADGAAKPGTSNLNFAAGQTIANRALVPMSSSGAIDIYNSSGGVDVLVDVVGVVGSSGATYNGSFPLRLLDTRTGLGGYGSLTGGTWDAIQIAGQPGIPGSGVRAVVINLTVTNPSTYSYVSANSAPTPSGTSDVNFYAGQTIANLAVVPVSADGKIYVYNSVGSTDVLVDVCGWYA